MLREDVQLIKAIAREVAQEEIRIFKESLKATTKPASKTTTHGAENVKKEAKDEL